MRNRNCWIWIAFACCACLVAAAMLWLTRSVIHTERERAIAEIRAVMQEHCRLSLWRMDSLGASALLEENAIPAALFLSEPVTTLPALARFESPDGAAMRGTGDPDSLALCSTLLPEELEKFEGYVTPLESKLKGGAEGQEVANSVEKMKRASWLADSLSRQNQSYGSEPEPQKPAQRDTASRDLENANPIGDFKPLWFEGSLFLIRRGMTFANYAQGTLVDEGKLKEQLLAEARPLLPGAKLIRVENEPDDSFVLASFPFKLMPGSMGATHTSIPKTISASLLVGWLAVLIALIAAYFLIANVMKLSERRASFVSAVTHELRTPLTTFRLYSDMLSSGAVKEEKRPMYLSVLSREADRLSHLVENVLAFSKIERGSARSTVSKTELNGLLESFRERFSTRLEAADLKLNLSTSEPIAATLDRSALEHILFNLIDNAAKYAAASDPPIVDLSARIRKGRIEISVRDNGPGISKAECNRVFRPFHKSAEQAAETKPGVGLGLALSKRLAQSMGGKLACRTREDGGTGACFVLSLPHDIEKNHSPPRPSGGS
jgi:signal transduction histidine kinase